MINAYILIHVRTGFSDDVIKEMRKIQNIRKISIIAGDYDIVIRVEVRSLDRLLKVTNKIQMIKGVSKTTTHIIEKEIAL